MSKKIVSFLCIAAILFSLCSCGVNTVTKSFDGEIKSTTVSEAFIAENDNFILECNEKNYGITLKNKKTGQTWGTSPKETDEVELDEFGLPKARSYQLESVFLLKYLEYASNTEVTALSYDAVTNGRVRCEKIENGLKVEYYLDSIEMMIPVEFVLYEDYVDISVNPKEIQESKNKVVKISLAPYWCSAKNDSTDSYLFVPSGQGAIVTPETRTEPIKTFSAPVYGRDYAMEETADTSNEHNILLPVIGARAEGQATAAIIDKGAEAAEVSVEAGDSMIGYSAVYATFLLRGYTYHTSTMFSSKKVDSTIYAENIFETPISVRYYPISGDKANYSGMAEVYRNYLTEVYNFKDQKADKALNLNIIGGTMVTQSFLGVPYKTLYSATTLNEAYDIVSDLSKAVETQFSVKLKGFGNTGIDVGNIGGKYKIDKKLGKVKQLKQIEDICGSLYMDFDLLRFSSASDGFSPYFDSIMGSTNQKAYQYNYDLAVHSQIEESLYYLLSPKSIGEAVSKLAKKTRNWHISGVSLESLSGMIYSDYSDRSSTEYYARSGVRAVITEALNKAKANGKKLMATKPNDYAAAISDIVVDAPLSSTGSYIFEYDVPFYQMVFKGYVPISSESVNLAANTEELILRAVEGGCGLSYTVTERWNNSLIDADNLYFYNSNYSDLKESIVFADQRLSDYYSKISGAHILSHKVLAEGVRETVFDNGVKVYVNYTDTAFTVSNKEIAPRDFFVLESVS